MFWLVMALVTLSLFAQGLTDLLAGELVGSKNYYGQPLGPILQLIGVTVIIVVACLAIWRDRRAKVSDSNDNKEPAPRPQEPPFRWPWD